MKAVLALAMATWTVVGCNRGSDTQSQKALVGTWILKCQYGSGSTTTNTITIQPDGSYDCRVATPTRVARVQGVFRVQNGFLVDTMTNSSTTGAPLPVVSRAQILRIDNREMFLQPERIEGVTYPTNEPVYRKVSR